MSDSRLMKLSGRDLQCQVSSVSQQHGSSIELQPINRRSWTITEKAPAKAFSWLKALYSPAPEAVGVAAAGDEGADLLLTRHQLPPPALLLLLLVLAHGGSQY